MPTTYKPSQLLALLQQRLADNNTEDIYPRDMRDVLQPLLEAQTYNSRRGVTILTEDLTDLYATDSRLLVINQTAWVKHFWLKGAYDPATDRTSTQLRLVEDSLGPVACWINDDLEMEYRHTGRWVRMTGTETEIVDSYPIYDPAQPVQKRDKRRHRINGVWKLFEAKEAQLSTPTTTPTGRGDDPFWFAYAPEVPSFVPYLQYASPAAAMVARDAYKLTPNQLVEIQRGEQPAVRLHVLDIYTFDQGHAFVRTSSTGNLGQQQWEPCRYDLDTDQTAPRSLAPASVTAAMLASDVRATATVATVSSTVVRFTQNADYGRIYSGTFTVDTAGARPGVVVFIRLTAAASAPAAFPPAFELAGSGAYVANKKLLYAFLVGDGGTIQYTISQLA